MEVTMNDVEVTRDNPTPPPGSPDGPECLAYYGLDAAPFRASVEPKLLWLGRRQQEVLTTLSAGIRDGAGIFVVTSDIGTGKTSLTHSLIDRLKDDDVLIGRVTNPGHEISEFFQAVAHAYRLKGTFETKDAFVTELQQRLATDGASRKKVLLIIDEAQSLSADLLREIRDLSIIGTTQGQSLAILLVGQNDLAATLAEEAHAALRQRIALKCTLDPLTPHEVGEYIEHCLKIAGATHEIFGSEAVREIALVSRGTPAVINAICDRALLAGFARRAPAIGRDIIEACCANLPAVPGKPARHARNGAVPRPISHRAIDTRARNRTGARGDIAKRMLRRAMTSKAALYLGLTTALIILVPIGYSLYAGWFARVQQATPAASHAASEAPPSQNAPDTAPAPATAASVAAPSEPPSSVSAGASITLPEQPPRESPRPKLSTRTEDRERLKSTASSRGPEPKPRPASPVQTTRPSDVSIAPAPPRPEPTDSPRVSREPIRRRADSESDASDPAGIIDWLLTQGRR
jgi:general secretion pathway protein A